MGLRPRFPRQAGCPNHPIDRAVVCPIKQLVLSSQGFQEDPGPEAAGCSEPLPSAGRQEVHAAACPQGHVSS